MNEFEKAYTSIILESEQKLVATEEGKYENFTGSIKYLGNDGDVKNATFELKDGKIFWEDGIWKAGIWEDGIFNAGAFVYGQWKNGIVKGGEWFRGFFENGIWENGKWIDGTWENGIWKNGKWTAGYITSKTTLNLRRSKKSPRETVWSFSYEKQ
jgi:hypothetical protein